MNSSPRRYQVISQFLGNCHRHRLGVLSVIVIAACASPLAAQAPKKGKSRAPKPPAASQPKEPAAPAAEEASAGKSSAAATSAARAAAGALANPILILLRDPGIHQELKLTAEQVAKVDQALATVDEPVWRLRDIPAAESASALAEWIANVEVLIVEILKPEQHARLNQLVIQAQGLPALLRLDVAKNLTLNKAQAKQIAEILRDTAAQVDKIRQEAGATPTAEHTRRAGEAQAAARGKIMGAFTPAQKKKLLALVGSEYDMSTFRQRASKAPELRGVTEWINSPPLTMAQLRGQVVALHYFAYG